MVTLSENAVPGGVISMELVDVSTPAGVTMSSAKVAAYVHSTPENPVVDGLFSEWIDPQVDRKDDAGNPDVNLRAMDARSHQEDTYFYLRVEGKILYGDAVPSTRALTIPSPGSGKPSEPSDNPSSSSGTQEESPLPMVTGEDAVYIFLDTRPDEGYRNAYIDFDADAMIEIKGKEGKITSSRYYSFDGNVPDEWSWRYERDVISASAQRELEAKVREQPLQAYFHIVSWNESYDDWSDDAIRLDKISIPGAKDYNDGITVNGIAGEGEWNAADKVDSESSGDGDPSAVDIVDVYLAHDDSTLFVRLDFYGDVGSYTTYDYFIFLDTDQSSGTGMTYGSWATGGDYLLWDDKFYVYSGTNHDWGWTEITSSSMVWAASGKIIEASIDISDIPEPDTDPSTGVNVFTRTDYPQGTENDIAPNSYSSTYSYPYTSNTYLSVSGIDISHSLVESGSDDNAMMELVFTATGATITVVGITVQRTGFDGADSDVQSDGVSLYDDLGTISGLFDSGDSEVAGAVGTFSSGSVTLAPSTSLSIVPGTPKRYYVVLDISASPVGKTIGVKIEADGIGTTDEVNNLPTELCYSWIDTPLTIDTSTGRRLAIYYGWPSVVNGALGDVTKAVATFDDYDVIVFGDHVTGEPSSPHPDKVKTQQIIAGLQQLGKEVFGYIAIGENGGSPHTIIEMESYCNYWLDEGTSYYNADGIFWDEAGYDFDEAPVTRTRQNTMIDYVHGKSKKNFMNSWDPDDVMGGDYHATANPDQTPTHLQSGDYYLLESFLMSIGSYRDASAVEAKNRKCFDYRNGLGIRMFAVDTEAGSSDGPTQTEIQDQVDYGWNTVLMFDFDGYQYTDFEYSSPEISGWWNEADLPEYDQDYPSGMGSYFEMYGVNYDAELDNAWRRTGTGQFIIDFVNHDAQFTTTIPGSISIDGSFSDWTNVVKSTDADDMTDSNIDILDYYVSDDETDLSFRVDVQGTICGASSGTNIYYIFIDIDRDFRTGYSGAKASENIGAEYVVQIEGSGGTIITTKLYSYNLVSGTSWSWTDTQEDISSATGSSSPDNKKLETEIALVDIGMNPGDAASIFFAAEETSGSTMDFVSDSGPASPSGYYTMVPEISGIIPPILSILGVCMFLIRKRRRATGIL